MLYFGLSFKGTIGVKRWEGYLNNLIESLIEDDANKIEILSKKNIKLR